MCAGAKRGQQHRNGTGQQGLSSEETDRNSECIFYLMKGVDAEIVGRP
jgi:hypothetical protein